MNNNAIDLEFKLVGDCYSVGLRGKDVILTTNIPAFDPDRYHHYRQAYWKLFKRNSRINGQSTNVITLEDLATIRQNLDKSATNLLHAFNHWGESPQFAKIAKAICDRSENLRVTISTECEELRKLPFHKWSLFPDGTEVTFSGVEAKEPDRTRHPDKIRILVILGDTTGINIEEDEKTIKEYCGKDAELVFLAQPDRSKLTATLADANGWDIIFFSGHSEAGQISINPAEDLTMAELKDVLAPAIAKRVQIFIFNSCDGLKLAPDLEKLSIDRLIVMRELIPDPIAPEFLKSFLKAFTGGEQFDDAVKSARQDLVDFEETYPYVSWLPIVIQNRLVASVTWQGLGKIRSPFKGLAAFTEADADKFYGREETIERYAKLVATAPLVPIIGASGSGKSSLVQAGLIPYLKQDAARDWQILTMRPGRNPFDALAKAIFNADQADLKTIELDVDLAGDRQLLTQKLAQIRIPQRRILLFIDQFEELFTQSDDEAARQIFLQSLADAVNDLKGFVLVFTLRNDFLPTLQSDRQDKDFTGMLGRFGFQSFDGRMTDGQFKAAITKPVEKLGVEFEDRLVDRLMKDVGTANGSLPLLQLVMDLLWKNVQKRQLTHECYNAIGGKDGMKTVLIKLADDVYDGFVKQGKVKEFKQVFLRLVTINDSNIPNTRKIATRADIGEANWREIVVPLSKKRLLKTDLNEKGEEIAEVIHESLIRHWQRLENWISKYHDELEQIEELETAARKWNKNNKAEQYLWKNKQLKDAKRIIAKRDLVIYVKPIIDIFMRACSRNQRWSKAPYWGFGIWVTISILAVLIEHSMHKPSIKIVQAEDKKQCTPQLEAAIKSIARSTFGAENLDLTERDLSCIRLTTGGKMSGANFSRSKLKSVVMQDVNLKGANLSHADLSHADLSHADLSYADLSYADLSHTNLRHTSFFGTEIKGANLDRANLKDVDLIIDDVKLAKNWEKAEYDPDVRKKLGLP
jgi:Pentapeptide repeats (8 copies)/AAA ATPase domain